MSAKSFLQFEYVPPQKGRKTGIWHVLSNGGTQCIGFVKWHSQWRRFCFFPEPETLFDQGCLHEICGHLERANMEHRQDLREERGMAI